MKKILIIGVVLLVLCVSISAVSADDDWSFSWSSSDSSNSDGGEMTFENGKLTLQGIEFTIPEGYVENESAQKLAVPDEDWEDAKISVCQFQKDGQDIIVKVLFFDDDDHNIDLNASEAGAENKTISDINGMFNPDKYGDNTPTFTFVKDGKLIEVNAPDEETLASVIK